MINISTKQLVDKVEITVKDNSGSMTSEKFSRLDSPFPSDKVEGLGLGLTIVKSILLRRCSSIRFFRDGHDCLTCKITVPVIV
ncbi:ATP-binding protein [uncultured Parasutterella sp.]|uniref:ATP-binding protein n=1 Tax=uncultured Parasutterella sp. TaxID=1263098 RepID=UPI00351CC365